MKTQLVVSELESGRYGGHFAIAKDANGDEVYIAPAVVRSVPLSYHGATILATVTPNAAAGRLPIATEVELLLP